MDTKTQAVIKFLDDYLTKTNRANIGAPEANALLDEAGILNDNTTRKGKPLREMLRAGKLPHAFQSGVTWIIPHSNKK